MFFDTHNVSECCGCTACESICPAVAIMMKPNNKGFYLPEVNEELCIHCNLCRKTCDFSSADPCENTVLKAYGMYHASEDVLKTSRSGGAFYMIAERIISENGCVWGVAFDNDLRVIHKRAKTMDELRALQGSKYVQSDLQKVFPQVCDDLQSGQCVLFSGTACQVSGLLRYLKAKKVETNRLITCDIVCQGVPSPKIFEEYKAWLERKHGGRRLKEFNFRDKTRIGWKGHEESFRFVGENRKHYSRRYASYFYGYYMRESCFECKYAGVHRPGDFTVGDFWGVYENYPQFANADGNSLVLVNTEKGAVFFGECNAAGNIWEVDLGACLQPRLRNSSARPENYETFWEELKGKGFDYCIRKYGKETLKSRLIYLIKPPLRRIGIIK